MPPPTPTAPPDKEILQKITRKYTPWVLVLCTFFGLTSFFSYATLKEFKTARTELRAQAKEIIEIADAIRSDFQQQRELFAIAPALNDAESEDEIRLRAGAVLDDPNGVSDSLAKVVANAYLLHLNGDTSTAVIRLRAVATALEGVDDEEAANSLYAAGSMLQNIETGNEGVLALFNEAIRLNPEYYQAYNNRGIENANLGYIDAALADFAESIRLDPKSFRGYTNRATMNANRGIHDAALEDFETALRLAPNNAIIYMDRSDSLVALDRIEDACDGFATALQLARDSGNPDLAEDITRKALEAGCNLEL